MEDEAGTTTGIEGRDGVALAVSTRPIVELSTERAVGWFTRMTALDGVTASARSLAAAVDLLADGPPPPEGGLVLVPTTRAELQDPDLLDGLGPVGVRLVLELQAADLYPVRPLFGVLDALASRGIHLAVTDVETVGPSTLAQVRPSILVLGESVAASIVSDRALQGVVGSVCGGAHGGGAFVVADGVATDGQADRLSSLGVTLASGPLFGPGGDRWAEPVRRRPRPRLDLDRTPALRDRLLDAHDVVAVGEALCDQLHDTGRSVAFYLERDGLLRCLARAGRPHILDGVPVRAGLLGEVFRTATVQTQVSTDDDSGPTSNWAPIRLGLPVRVGGRIVGVVELAVDETMVTPDPHQAASLVRMAEERLTEIGVSWSPTSVERLVHAINELGSLDDRRHVEVAASRLASEVGQMSSAMLAVPNEKGELVVSSVQGPLAGVLQTIAADAMDGAVRAMGEASSLFAGPSDEVGSFELVAHLGASGASTIAAFPVRTVDQRHALLVVADHAPIDLGIAERESLETLARQIGSRLDLVSALADLRLRATVDPLTGLGNVAAFQDAVAAVGGRRRGRWAILIADVDGLKQVNDTQGHQAGDRLLRRVAVTLDEVLRAEDRMFRIGGDEFAALLHEVDSEGAGDVGDRMCEAVTAVLDEFGAGLSIGIAVPEIGETATEFIDRADQTLYEVKRSAPGTARVAPYTGTRDVANG